GFVPCSSPVGYTALADGSHTVQVRATDAAGNTDPSPAAYSWRVDTTPPTTSVDLRPSERTKERQSSFRFAADETVAAYECSLDSAAPVRCSSPYRTPSLADGSHALAVRAT